MTSSVEKRVAEIAGDMSALGANEDSHVFKMSWWSDHMMSWAMARPEFKTQLFRFVDVFPAMHGSDDVIKHMHEYFSGATVPRFVDLGVDIADASVVGRPVAAAVAKRNIEQMARQFIAGNNVEDAKDKLLAMWSAGSGYILDLLGEKTLTSAEADQYRDRVTGILDELSRLHAEMTPIESLAADDIGELPLLQVSIKPSALTCNFNSLSHDLAVDEICDRAKVILAFARETDCLIWFDMEQCDAKDIVLDAFKRIAIDEDFLDMPIGIVVQAYLRDSYDDLTNLIELSSNRITPLSVRLVKGAYWDSETINATANDWPIPVWQEKAQSDANYERCARLLHDNHGSVRAAFASHNLRSISYAVAYARESGIPNNGFEVQMLYGMAEPMHAGVRGLGIRHRVYTPIGELVPGMSYLVRRLLENTSNESFVRMRFAEDKSIESLIGVPNANLDQERVNMTIEETDVENPSAYSPEPMREWRNKAAHDRFAKAVDEALEIKSKKVSKYVAGHWKGNGSDIVSVNPNNPERVVALAVECSVADTNQAVVDAIDAFESWSQLPFSQRSRILFKAASWLRERRDEIAAVEIVEAGKPWAEADGDVCEAIDFLEYYGRQGLKLGEGAEVQSTAGEMNAMSYRGKGVVGVISPWNFPLAIPTGQVSASLVAGNCVVFKPAEQTPLTASYLVQALHEAGIPSGVLTFLPGRGETVGARLVEHPDVSLIAFTGSLDVGLQIVKQAADVRPGQNHIKNVIAELGGKNALIVDSDADIDQVIPIVLQSAFGFAGQKCSALSRLIVVDDVYKPLTERLAQALQELQVGDPSLPETKTGPVIDEDSYKRLSDVVANASSYGEVLAQKTSIPDVGYYIQPTVIRPKSTDEYIWRNELFGPVLCVMPAKSFDEAIQLANDTPFALTAGCISRSPQHIQQAKESLRAGNIYINRGITGAIVGRHPFGGYGLSGVGSKAGGPDYLLQFVQPRATSENTMRQGFAPELLGGDA